MTLPIAVLHHGTPSGDEGRTFEQFRLAAAGNTGNAVIGHAMTRLLGGRAVLDPVLGNVLRCIDPVAQAQRLNRESSGVILCTQDWIVGDDSMIPTDAGHPEGTSNLREAPTLERIAELIRHLRVPVVVVSLCANNLELERASPSSVALAPAVRRLVEAMSGPHVSVGTRGELTAGLLRAAGMSDVTAVGCPSLYLAGPRLTLRPVERALEGPVYVHGLHGLHRDDLFYVPQGDGVDAPLLAALSNSGEVTAEAIAPLNLTYPGAATALAAAWRPSRLRLPASVAEWRTMAAQASLAVGTRVHGSIVALSAGVPTILTAGDLRAKETAGFFSLPHHVGAAITDDTLQGFVESLSFQEAQARYPDLRARFLGWLSDRLRLGASLE